MFKKRVLAVLLSVVMTATMLVALPTAAHAANGPVTIDLDSLALLGADDDNLGHATQSEWSYDDDSRILTLHTPNGDYTLIGTDTDVKVLVASTAIGATIKLEEVVITADVTDEPVIDVYADCTIWVDGVNFLDNADGPGITIHDSVKCTLVGPGTLMVTADYTTSGHSPFALLLYPNAELSIDQSVWAIFENTNNLAQNGAGCASGSRINVAFGAMLDISGPSGISTSSNFTLNVDGTCNINASAFVVLSSSNANTFSGSGTITLTGSNYYDVIYTDASILMDDNITLVINRNIAGSETRSFTKASTATTHAWMLSGDASFAGSSVQVDAAVNITIAQGTSTIKRAVLVCEIVGGAQYFSIEDALADAVDDDTIRLLVDVTLSAQLEIDNGVTFTFDTNGKTLNFNDYGLVISDGSDVSFIGCLVFLALGWIDVVDNGTKAEFDDSLVMDDYIYADNEVEVTINGDLTVLYSDGINAENGATVTVTGSIEAAGDGVVAYGGAIVTVGGDITAGGDGVVAYGGAIVTVTGDIYAGEDGVYASSGAEVTINGSIYADDYGVYASNGAEVTINGSISADDGVYADGATVAVKGGITAVWDGVYVSSGSPTVVVVDGEIHAGENGVFIDDWDGFTRNASVTVNSDIFAGYAGVRAWLCVDCIVTVNGNITADYIGVFAWNGVEVFINGDIVVLETAALSPTDILVGVAAGFGAEVTVDGTITVLDGHYIALYFESTGGSLYSYTFVAPNENVTPSSKASFLEYNDSDELMSVSTVWVKDPRTLTPGTGDNTTLWLLFGALLVAALGAGCVIAYRRREQQV